MKYFKKFITTPVTDGFVVLVSISILYFVIMWIWGFLLGMIEPLTGVLLKYIDMPKFVADMAILVIILLVCFFVGNLIRTRIGKWTHEWLEGFSFYKIVKGFFSQIFSGGGLKKILECPAAIVYFSPEISAPALVTEDNGNGLYTVFLLTAPNPMSGLEFYVPKERVRIMSGKDARDLMLQTIFSCGIGSKKIFELLEQEQEKIKNV